MLGSDWEKQKAAEGARAWTKQKEAQAAEDPDTKDKASAEEKKGGITGNDHREWWILHKRALLTVQRQTAAGKKKAAAGDWAGAEEAQKEAAAAQEKLDVLVKIEKDAKQFKKFDWAAWRAKSPFAWKGAVEIDASEDEKKDKKETAEGSAEASEAPLEPEASQAPLQPEPVAELEFESSDDEEIKFALQLSMIEQLDTADALVAAREMSLEP